MIIDICSVMYYFTLNHSLKLQDIFWAFGSCLTFIREAFRFAFHQYITSSWQTHILFPSRRPTQQLCIQISFRAESCLSLQQISKFRLLALILNKPSNINHRRYAAVDTKAVERHRPLQMPKVTKTMKRIWQARYAFNRPVKSCRETPEVTQTFEWCQGGERFLIFTREQLVQALALTHMKLGTDA